MEKIFIIHASSERANFLGFEIHITPIGKRSIIVKKNKEEKTIKVIQTTRPLISAPISLIVEKLKEKKYCRGKRNNPTRLGKLIHLTKSQIVNHYRMM